MARRQKYGGWKIAVYGTSISCRGIDTLRCTLPTFSLDITAYLETFSISSFHINNLTKFMDSCQVFDMDLPADIFA